MSDATILANVKETTERDVRQLYLDVYPDGLTADEAAARLGKSVLAVRPTVSMLYKHEGFLEKTGQKRANESGLGAHVWRWSLRTNP